MDLPAFQTVHEFQPIPPIFHSYATGEPFTNCITCERHLLKDGESYVVEKAIRNYRQAGVQDVIFEYAMCLDCAQKLRQELSEDSRNRIDAYFLEKTDLVARREALLALPEPMKLQNWLSNCLITGEDVEQTSDEYILYGQCDGSDLVYTYMPYTLSNKAMEEINSLISPKTREILDDFMDTHFGLPPELRVLLQDKLVLL